MMENKKQCMPVLGALLASILCGIIIIFPFHNFQPQIAQGDHGRDLYVFRATLDGQIPYQDYQWNYGPLMPYYYSLCYSWWGVGITSILLGRLVLTLLAGGFVFGALCRITTLGVAFLGSLWFYRFNPDFFHTYNHAGGVTFLLATIWAVLSYLKNPRPIYFWLGLFFAFLVALVKFNMGISTIVAYGVAISLIEQQNGSRWFLRKSFLLAVFFLAILTVILIYFLLLHNLPIYEILQDIPLLGRYQPDEIRLRAVLQNYLSDIWQMINSDPLFIAVAFLVAGTVINGVHLLLSRKTPVSWKKENGLIGGILLLFSVLSLHEFWQSGTIYRLYWARGIDFLMAFFLFSLFVNRLPQRFKFYFFLVIFLIISWKTFDRNMGMADFKRQTSQYLSFNGEKVFATNPPEWFSTVTKQPST